MRAIKPLLVAALLAVPGALSGQVPADAKAAIAKGNQAWQAGWNAGDAAAIANLYTEDAHLLAPGVEGVKGREAIRTELASQIAAAEGVQVKLETGELLGQGDTVVEVGSFVMTAADGAHADHGKYIAVWKKVGGNWKISHDIWNSSM